MFNVTLNATSGADKHLATVDPFDNTKVVFSASFSASYASNGSAALNSFTIIAGSPTFVVSLITQISMAASSGNDEVFNNVPNWPTSFNGYKVSGGDGNDSIVGSGRNDQYSGGLGADWAAGRGGSDVLNGDGNADSLFGEVGNDTLNGGNGGDWIVGGGGSDSILGSNNNDLLNSFDSPSLQDALISGGSGTDTLTPDSADNLRTEIEVIA